MISVDIYVQLKTFFTVSVYSHRVFGDSNANLDLRASVEGAFVRFRGRSFHIRIVDGK